MKVHATLNNLRIAPRKVRLVTRALVGMNVHEALLQLSKQTKKSSQPVHDLLKSALANAANNFGLDASNMFVLEVRVGDGLRLKRWAPKAFGRATPLLRRGSNVTVILEEKVVGKNRRVEKKAIAPETVETAATEEKEKIEETAEPAHVHAHVVKSETKKETVKTVKPAVGKAVRKVFQRKSM